MVSVKGYLSEDLLASLGAAAIGENVFIHESVLIVNASALTIGSNVRIDAFTVITCGDEPCSIGDHVHISTHVLIAGRGGFDLGNCSGIASGCRLFTTSDDFSGEVLTGPTFPAHQTGVTYCRIRIGDHAVMAANSVVLPGGGLGEGAILGALSLAKTRLDPWTIYGGTPARAVKPRSRTMLEKLGPEGSAQC
jgi:galactoside O-acetyltransferase